MIEIVRAKGAYLYDDKGKDYLDCTSGGTFASHIGYGVEEVASGICEQAKNLSLFGFGDIVSRTEEELKALLGEKFQKYGNEAVIFPSWKDAFNYVLQWIRFICSQQREKMDGKVISYFGANYSSSSNFMTVYPPYCYRCPYGANINTCGLLCAEKFEERIIAEDPETIAAFFAEPISSFSPGVVSGPVGYLEKIFEICKKHNIIFVADERISAGGRTGQYLAVEHTDVIPDIIIIGNGLSGGYLPIGATIFQKDVQKMHQITDNLYNPIPFTGNAMACASSICALRYLNKTGIVSNAKWLGDFLLESMNSLLELPIVGDVRGLGLYLGIDFVADKSNRSPFPNNLKITDLICEEAAQKGLLLSTSDYSRFDFEKTLICAPPLIIGEKEANRITETIYNAIKSVMKSL